MIFDDLGGPGPKRDPKGVPVNLQLLLLVLVNFEYFLYWICIFLLYIVKLLIFHWFYKQKWDMQIRVKKTKNSEIFEVLNFCSWSLLICNILIIESQIEVNLPLPRPRAYTSIQKSIEKHRKYVYLAHVRFFWHAFWLCCVFVSKKLPKVVFWAPL